MSCRGYLLRAQTWFWLIGLVLDCGRRRLSSVESGRRQGVGLGLPARSGGSRHHHGQRSGHRNAQSRHHGSGRLAALRPGGRDPRRLQHAGETGPGRGTAYTPSRSNRAGMRRWRISRRRRRISTPSARRSTRRARPCSAPRRRPPIFAAQRDRSAGAARRSAAKLGPPDGTDSRVRSERRTRWIRPRTQVDIQKAERWPRPMRRSRRTGPRAEGLKADHRAGGGRT